MSFERALNNQFSRKLQDLITLLTSIDTKLSSIDTRLDNCDSSLNTIEADSGFIKSRLYDSVGNQSAGELLADIKTNTAP